MHAIRKLKYHENRSGFFKRGNWDVSWQIRDMEYHYPYSSLGRRKTKVANYTTAHKTTELQIEEKNNTNYANVV